MPRSDRGTAAVFVTRPAGLACVRARSTDTMGKRAAEPAQPAAAAPKRRACKFPCQYITADTAFEDEETNLTTANDASAAKKQRKVKDSAGDHVRKQIVKCLKDNFAAMDDQEIYSAKAGGYRLFETLWNDKMRAHSKDASAPRFGKTYFDEKKGVSSPRAALCTSSSRWTTKQLMRLSSKPSTRRAATSLGAMNSCSSAEHPLTSQTGPTPSGSSSSPAS